MDLEAKYVTKTKLVHFGFVTQPTCTVPSISLESNIALASIVPNSVYTHRITVAVILISSCTLISVYRT